MIYGTSRKDLNGKCGVAVDFHLPDGRNAPESWRYTIRLATGDLLKIKTNMCRSPSSPEAVREGGGGSVAPLNPPHHP